MTSNRNAPRFRGYGFSQADWRAVCERHRHRCAICGTTGNLTVDHIIPVAAGGTDALDNIQPLCSRCNATKGSRYNGRNYRRGENKESRIAVRLTDECDNLITALRRKYGITSGAVVEMAIREYAERRSVTLADAKQEGE